jgi:hypothetical protein
VGGLALSAFIWLDFAVGGLARGETTAVPGSHIETSLVADSSGDVLLLVGRNGTSICPPVVVAVEAHRRRGIRMPCPGYRDGKLDVYAVWARSASALADTADRINPK